MGSKSSSAPAPDPRLTQAQISSIQQQNAMLQRTVQQADELLPLQKQQLQFGLDTAKSAYEQSQADRDWMLTRRAGLSGLQDKLVSEAETFNTEGRTRELMEQAGADVSSAFAGAREQGQRGLSRMGITPGSGRSLSMSAAMDTAQAVARSAAANRVREAARAEGYALTDRATNALAGYPAMSAALTTTGAGLGASGLGLANTGLAGMTAGYTAAASGYGGAANAASNAFSAQANYKNAQDQLASQRGSGLMGLAGTVAGAYLMGPGG